MTRHPHSQAFHDEVDALLRQYESGCEEYEKTLWDTLLRTWNGFSAGETVRYHGIAELCTMGSCVSLTMQNRLQHLALYALVLISHMPHHTIGVVELLDRMKTTHDRKQADYGTSAEPFANVLASRELGVDPIVAVLVRMNDKVTRIRSFLAKGQLENESVEDSLLDIAVYAMISVVVINEQLGAMK